MHKKRILYTLVVVFSALIWSCGSKNKGVSGNEIVNYTILVEGMTCTGCEQTIQAKVGRIEGVENVSASHTTGEVQVGFYSSVADTTQIKVAIAGAGYIVKSLHIIQSDSIK